MIDAASTKPFGFMRFDPGPGMGGHCLPVDPFYLAFKAREHDFYPEFIELAGKVNQAQPAFCVDRIERALNEAGKPVNGSRILILGVSYKAGVGDIRESPALKIIRLLRELGAEVSYHDPHVAELPEFGSRSADLDEALAPPTWSRSSPPIPSSTTARSSPTAPLVVDFRGVTRGIEGGEPGPALASGDDRQRAWVDGQRRPGARRCSRRRPGPGTAGCRPVSRPS